MKSYVWWSLLFGAVGWGESKGTKKPLYEAALKSAWLNANLFEFMLPALGQVLPDLTITKVLYVPPYNQNVKLIHTAQKLTPVRIKYLFRGVTGNATDLFTKGKWLCEIFIDEHLYDGEYYYLYPWNNLIHCEVDDEGEGDDGGPPAHVTPKPTGAPGKSKATLPTKKKGTPASKPPGGPTKGKKPTGAPTKGKKPIGGPTKGKKPAGAPTKGKKPAGAPTKAKNVTTPKKAGTQNCGVCGSSG